MKLKIEKILETKQPYQPQGKVYKIYQWVVKGLLDGEAKEYMLVKAFTQIPFGEGMEMDVKEDNYQGNISYTVQKEKSSGFKSGYSKPTYTQKEYDLLFAHAFNVIKPFVNIVDSPFERLQVTSSLLATYLISAANAGVKIEQLDKKLDKKDPAKKFVEDHKEDLDENMTGIFNEDKDIPF